MTAINATRVGPSGRVTGSAMLIIERADGELYVGLGFVFAITGAPLVAAQQAQLAAAADDPEDLADVQAAGPNIDLGEHARPEPVTGSRCPTASRPS